jgi:hypothetical protein
MRKFEKTLVLLITAGLIASCVNFANTKIHYPTVKAAQLPFLPAFYDSVFSINNKIIAFAFNHTEKEIIERTLYANMGDSKLNVFQPIDISGCFRPLRAHLVTLLPDGRVGFLSCAEADPDYNPLFFVRPKPDQAFKSMFAFDWETGEVEKIVKDPLTPGYSPKNFTWNPDMSWGVQEMVDGHQGTINWISQDGIAPMNIKIEVQGMTWNLNSYYEDQSLRKGKGFVISPAWSPDGKTIAFFASTYGMKEEPILSWEIEYNLYFMDPDEQKPREVLRNIVNAHNLGWSPNNERLSFSGCVVQFSQCGLWVYEIESDQLYFISEGEFHKSYWLSDQTILAIKNIGEPFDNNEIWEYIIQDW